MTNSTAAASTMSSDVNTELAISKAMREDALAMLDEIADFAAVFGTSTVDDTDEDFDDETDDEVLARLQAEALADGNETLAAIYARTLATAPGTYADDEGDY